MNPDQFIDKIVDEFYSLARKDIFLAYQFIKIPDFDEHLPKIYAFWKFQLDISAHRPSQLALIPKHKDLKIKKGELGRWMTLFKEVLEKNKKSKTNFDHISLIHIWTEKLENFNQIFLQSQELFPQKKLS